MSSVLESPVLIISACARRVKNNKGSCVWGPTLVVPEPRRLSEFEASLQIELSQKIEREPMIQPFDNSGVSLQISMVKVNLDEKMQEGYKC